jgi:hypothetical protein
MTSSTTPVTICCPHCGRQVDLDEALVHQLAAPMRADWEAQIRQQVLTAQRAERDELEGRLTEREAEIKGLRAQEAELRRDRRKLEDEKEDLERAKEMMRDAIRKEERDQAAKDQQERYELMARRKDADHKTEVRQLMDKIERMNAQLEEAARRGATGSRQEEGFSRQDVFAEELRQRFPGDEITVIARGQAGADVTHHVRAGGRDCGTILWECKRAANWSGTWIGKLAGDVHKAGAAFGVIVTETLPHGMDGSGRMDEVWVCEFGCAVHLAAGLRWVLIAASQYEAANAARADTSGRVYDYIATGGFASRCDMITRAIEAMMTTLGKEKRYYEQRWKEWEHHIETVVGSLYGIAGDLVGLGAEVPPPLRAELPSANFPALADGTLGHLSK